MQVDHHQFEIHPSSGLPIYRQIMEQVHALVAGGKLTPGNFLPSVRQMGDGLQINMMTVSKAYNKLEAEGVLERVRGKGMRVRAIEKSGSVAARKNKLQPFIEAAVTRGLQLGLTEDQVMSLVRSIWRKRLS